MFPERCERDEQHATHGGVSSVLHLFPSHGPGRRCVISPSSPHHCNAPPFFFTEFFFILLVPLIALPSLFPLRSKIKSVPSKKIGTHLPSRSPTFLPLLDRAEIGRRWRYGAALIEVAHPQLTGVRDHPAKDARGKEALPNHPFFPPQQNFITRK